jgi:hypothetical protein
LGLFFDCNSPKYQNLKIALFKAINRNWQKYEQGIMPQSQIITSFLLPNVMKEDDEINYISCGNRYELTKEECPKCETGNYRYDIFV